MAGQSISEIGDGPLSVVPLGEGMDKPNDSANAVSGSVLPLDSTPPISTPPYSTTRGRPKLGQLLLRTR
jgi:hypothetical protein